MRAGVTELRNTRNAARKRHLANAAKLRTEDGGGNTWRTLTKLRPDEGNYSSSNEARRCRRRAASAEGASRTPSGGRVITASNK